MKRTRRTPGQILRRLRTAEQLISQGKTAPQVCRIIEVKRPTFHRGRQQQGGGAE